MRALRLYDHIALLIGEDRGVFEPNEEGQYRAFASLVKDAQLLQSSAQNWLCSAAVDISIIES